MTPSPELLIVGLTFSIFVSFTRIVMTAYYNDNYIKDPSTQQYLWLVPVRDLLIPLEWLLGFAGQTIRWRGNRYRIQSGARIQKIAINGGLIRRLKEG